eukprot:scaffold255252_cov30-Tisochrysis_lutea.AAC.1
MMPRHSTVSGRRPDASAPSCQSGSGSGTPTKGLRDHFRVRIAVVALSELLLENSSRPPLVQHPDGRNGTRLELNDEVGCHDGVAKGKPHVGHTREQRVQRADVHCRTQVGKFLCEWANRGREDNHGARPEGSLHQVEEHLVGARNCEVRRAEHDAAGESEHVASL